MTEMLYPVEWRLDENCWYFCVDGEKLGRVDYIFLPLRGMVGWYFWYKGKRKPWINRQGPFSEAEMAKSYFVGALRDCAIKYKKEHNIERFYPIK